MRARNNLPNLINETSACFKTRFYVKFKSADVLRLFERFLIFEPIDFLSNQIKTIEKEKLEQEFEKQ